MSKTRLFYSSEPLVGVAAQVATADITGGAIDITDADEVLILANVGASGDTLSGSVKIELEVLDSENGTDFAAAANANVLNAVTGTNTGTFAVIDSGSEDDMMYKTSYLKTNPAKTHIQVKVNVTGTHTNGTPISMEAVKVGLRYNPA